MSRPLPLSRPLLPREFRLAFVLCVTVLAISGFAQMPIFRRYYIADVPGLAWTDDFYFTSLLHYLAAIAFLVLAGYAAGRHLTAWRTDHALTNSGILRSGLYALLIITGLAHVLGNSSLASLDSLPAMLVDMGHLASVMLLGLVSLLSALLGRRDWLRPRSS
ncbi:MAG: iron-sulfur cluster-binding protein [Desulfocurvibacter africanus]